MTIKKNAGFWIRFLSLLIDVTFFCIIGIVSSLMCISSKTISINEKSIHVYQISQYWTYYLWLIILLLLIIIQFIIFPIITKGKTMGMIITKLELKINDNNQKINYSIIKRIQLGALLWIIMLLLYISFVNPNTINKITLYSKIQTLNANNYFKDWTDEEKLEMVKFYKLTTLETTFITIPATISSITIFAQLLALITTGMNTKKINIIDKLTNTTIVYKNKYIQKEDIRINKIIEPIKNEEVEIIWKD